jgi:hypothetical protein
VARRSAEQRRRDRAAGVDRYGHPLPRVLGTNPRAVRQRALGASRPDGLTGASPADLPEAAGERADQAEPAGRTPAAPSPAARPITRSAPPVAARRFLSHLRAAPTSFRGSALDPALVTAPRAVWRGAGGSL